MTKTAHTPESIAALDARAAQGELSVFNSTLENGRFYIGTDNWAIAKSEIGATKPADFELFAALVNLYRAGRIAVLPEGIANPDVVPEAIAMLHEAARWFEDYARSHYQQARTAPSYGEQHSREVKGKLNQERCDAILAILAKLEGRS